MIALGPCADPGDVLPELFPLGGLPAVVALPQRNQHLLTSSVELPDAYFFSLHCFPSTN
jgi:hypothetical protein